MDAQSSLISGPPSGYAYDYSSKRVATERDADTGKRFEKMLWAEMLKHVGLEKTLTKNGGEAASAFSQYVIQAIAEDIAEKHPMGLSPPTLEVAALYRAPAAYDPQDQKNIEQPTEYPTLPAFEGLEYE